MKKNILARAILAAFVAVPTAALASEAELLQRIEKLAAELEKVKSELAATKQKTDTVEKRQETMAAAPASQGTAPGAPQTVVTGYGEINYTHPTKDASASQTDVRRAVIGIQHRFDDKTKLVSEFEFEHAVASKDDNGEVEVEQLYVEREFDNGLRAKAGLFLIPAGLLNTNHEPTAYYGVERNFVETAIIPSTWREVGVGLSSTLENGLTWDVGVTTGFNLEDNKFTGPDAADAAGELRESPLGSLHQEGQLAKSRHMSVHGALNWRGIPGLLLGGSVFTGKIGHQSSLAPDARVSLWDLHARYTPGRWDLAAVYARGNISGVGSLNQDLVLQAEPTAIPSSFAGWYTQAAYQLWKTGDYALTPFVRYERFNTAKSFTAVPAGMEVATGPDEKVVTVGANFKVTEGVVLKADYQKFHENTANNRVNLGLGFAF